MPIDSPGPDKRTKAEADAIRRRMERMAKLAEEDDQYFIDMRFAQTGVLLRRVDSFSSSAADVDPRRDKTRF